MFKKDYKEFSFESGKTLKSFLWNVSSTKIELIGSLQFCLQMHLFNI